LPTPFPDQHARVHEIPQRGIPIEQSEEPLGLALGATPDDERKSDHAWLNVGLEHGAVLGDDRNASVLLPQCKRLALLDPDLQLAGIELEHRGIRDPRMTLETLANLIDVKKYDRGVGRDARSRQHLFSADGMIAG